MTRQQEAESRMLNRFLTSDKRFFVPVAPVQMRHYTHASHCVVELHDAADLRYYAAINHLAYRDTFAAFRQKYSQVIKRVTLAGRVPLKPFASTCIAGVAASTETTEMQAAALEIARTKAALKFSDELYGKQKAETGLTSAQQFLAFKQAQREQQSE